MSGQICERCEGRVTYLSRVRVPESWIDDHAHDAVCDGRMWLCASCAQDATMQVDETAVLPEAPERQLPDDDELVWVAERRWGTIAHGGRPNVDAPEGEKLTAGDVRRAYGGRFCWVCWPVTS